MQWVAAKQLSFTDSVRMRLPRAMMAKHVCFLGLISRPAAVHSVVLKTKGFEHKFYEQTISGGPRRSTSKRSGRLALEDAPEPPSAVRSQSIAPLRNFGRPPKCSTRNSDTGKHKKKSPLRSTQHTQSYETSAASGREYQLGFRGKSILGIWHNVRNDYCCCMQHRKNESN